jgi:hypothetical protein
MHYVIQENVFRERHYELLLDTMRRGGFSHDIVRIFPFVDKIVRVSDIPNEEGAYNVDDLPEYVTDRNDVFVFGAIKLARIGADRGWTPGSMMNDNHDYTVYSKHYGVNLLNHDSRVMRLVDDFGWSPGEEKFLRPTKDTKAFTGKVFTETEWNDTVKHHLHNYRTDMFNEDTLVQVSTPKVIQKEIRFWVVGGKIVTGSQYRLGDAVVYDEFYEDEAIEFAQRMVDKFQLADSFVIDVCLCDDAWKIVECGCINCAGFYKSNIPKMVMALEERYG